jgi:glucose-6-phosphate-specific signal transduction histidine kinase
LDIQVAGVAAVVDCVAFLDGLGADLRTMHLGQRCVTIEIRAEAASAPFHHARQLGLIVNELVVNALKYAFPEGRGGTVSIAFECRSDTCTLTVKDDGIGVDPAAPPQGTGLGRRVVRALAAKLGGSFQIGPALTANGMRGSLALGTDAGSGPLRLAAPENTGYSRKGRRCGSALEGEGFRHRIAASVADRRARPPV